MRNLLFFASVALWFAIGSSANAASLSESVAVALESNPEIGQAVENREAIEFELRQSRGLFLPSIDLESSVGVRRLDNPSRRGLGIDDDSLYPSDVGITSTWTIFDGGGRRAERDRQASRVDGASFRVFERSETIALQVVREYLEYLLQVQIVGEAARNVETHRSILRDIRTAVSGGSLTEADRQQGQERLLSSRARLTEAEQELSEASIRFFKLVGLPINNATMPGSVAALLPTSLDEAIGLGRANNPRIKSATADLDAADALVDAARSEFSPNVAVESRARTGSDIDGVEGRTSDVQLRVVMRWNLFRGGIRRANVQEQVRRVSEQRLVIHQAHREVEQAVRISWDRRTRQRQLAALLVQQSGENGRLVQSYRQQFTVGRRSLLDVLDAQNSRFNTGVLAKTAQYSSIFADYRLLAATGQLVSAFGLTPPQQSEAYARQEFSVPETAPTETHRREPSRQEINWFGIY